MAYVRLCISAGASSRLHTMLVMHAMVAVLWLLGWTRVSQGSSGEPQLHRHISIA